MKKFVPLVSKEWLEAAYLLQDRTLQDIGKELGVDRSVVKRWLNEFSIDSKTLVGKQFGTS